MAGNHTWLFYFILCLKYHASESITRSYQKSGLPGCALCRGVGGILGYNKTNIFDLN